MAYIPLYLWSRRRNAKKGDFKDASDFFPFFLWRVTSQDLRSWEAVCDRSVEEERGGKRRRRAAKQV